MSDRVVAQPRGVVAWGMLAVGLGLAAVAVLRLLSLGGKTVRSSPFYEFYVRAHPVAVAVEGVALGASAAVLVRGAYHGVVYRRPAVATVVLVVVAVVLWLIPGMGDYKPDPCGGVPC